MYNNEKIKLNKNNNKPATSMTARFDKYTLKVTTTTMKNKNSKETKTIELK